MQILKRAAEGTPFLELLLDERWCRGTVLVEKEMLRIAGGINKRLHAKTKYELILRIAKEMPVVFEDVKPECGITEEELRQTIQISDTEYIVLEDDAQEVVYDFGWQTDCYIIGKYSSELTESGYFAAAAAGILEEAAAAGRYQQTAVYMESMIGHAPEFYGIDDVTRPILVYKGDTTCHNVLTVFAEQFGAALCRAGEHVIYFDVQKEELSCVQRYINQRFKAVIGMQSYLFSIKMLDKIHYLHEFIGGPKFDFIFDHPIWMKDHMGYTFQDYYILTHDSNYVSFASRYFHKKAMLLPPAGIKCGMEENLERIYDLTFVGNYGDYMEQVLLIHQMERPLRFLANRLLLQMRQNPDFTLEEAYKRTLEGYGLEWNDEMFVENLYKICNTQYCVMHYYRSKVIEMLLKGGIRVDVFGRSWYQCPLRKYPNLICHPDVTVEESLVIWQQSKLSLNVMSWHKGGFTERMAGIMLAGAVLVTDDTTYLRGQYDADDMIAFHLDRIYELPKQVMEMLASVEKREKMAKNGQRKTLQEHTWDKRAEQFLKLLEIME